MLVPWKGCGKKLIVISKTTTLLISWVITYRAAELQSLLLDLQYDRIVQYAQLV